MHTPPPSPVDLSFLYQLKSDGKTSGDFIAKLANIIESTQADIVIGTESSFKRSIKSPEVLPSDFN
jgi:hypothetical protein